MKVSEELLSRAKELEFEFQAPCDCGNHDGCICSLVRSVIDNYEYIPTQHELAKALRDKTNIHVYPELMIAMDDKACWVGTVSFLSEHLLFKDSARKMRGSYETAMEDALMLGLEMMEDIMSEEDEEMDDEDDDQDEWNGY